MSQNPQEPTTLTAELSLHEVAIAIVEYLVKYREWPTSGRYDKTNHTIGLDGKPHIFTAEFSPVAPGHPDT